MRIKPRSTVGLWKHFISEIYILNLAFFIWERKLIYTIIASYKLPGSVCKRNTFLITYNIRKSTQTLHSGLTNTTGWFKQMDSSSSLKGKWQNKTPGSPLRKGLYLRTLYHTRYFIQECGHSPTRERAIPDTSPNYPSAEVTAYVCKVPRSKASSLSF